MFEANQEKVNPMWAFLGYGLTTLGLGNTKILISGGFSLIFEEALTGEPSS